MVVTAVQLAGSMRIGDGVSALIEPELSIVTRLLGVGQAMVALHAPLAPEVMQDEAVTLMAAYLYDQQPAGRGEAFASAWRNSGAYSVVMPWIVRRAELVDGDGAAGAVFIPSGDGLNLAQVTALIGAHRGIVGAHHAPPDLSGFIVGLPILQGNILTFTLEDGTAGTITLPMTGAGVADGVVNGFTVDEATDVVTITTTTGGSFEVDLTPLLDAVGMGLSQADVDARMKAFARIGSTTPPLPADLAPDPMAGRVLGLRTAGGQLQTSWNQLSAGSPHFVLDTIPTPEQQAIGGLLPQGGVVLVRETDNHPTQLWVRISPAFALLLFHTFADPLVLPGSGGQLPAAEDFQGRIGLAGNHFYRSVNQGGADKVVQLKDWGPTRIVNPGEPVKLPQELAFVGSVANPPSGHFILDANAWDRGSQIWIINETADDDDWADWGGPVGYHAGHLHLTDDDARQHINAVADVGRVIIIGHGSGQIVRIVTFFSAATEDDWQWISIGVDIGDIVSIVGAHNTAAAVHTGQFTAVAANLAAHNQFSQAHADIRALITALQASGGLTFAAYSATATYSFGGSNSFVTHGNKLYFYRSTLSRSSNHDPGQHPGLLAGHV